jgi:lipase chaperone LimK
MSRELGSWRKGSTVETQHALLVSAMETDFDYLSAKAEESVNVSSLVHTVKRKLKNAFGTALCDDAATRNYISYKYAKAAKLPIQKCTGRLSCQMEPLCVNMDKLNLK